jgi:hypothetical protein
VSLGVLQPVEAQYSTSGGAPLPVSSILIDSPTNSTVYETRQVLLNFSVISWFEPKLGNITMTYSIDGKDNVTVPISATYVPFEYVDEDGNVQVSPFLSYYLVSGSVTLEDLQSGQHSLTVFGRYEVYSMPGRIGFDNQTIQFTLINDNSLVSSNPGNGGGISEFKPSIITVCVFVSVFLLIIVVAFVLFTKHRPKNASENTANIHAERMKIF